MPVPVLGDPRPLLRAALLAQPSLTSSAVGTRWSVRVPASPTYPLGAISTVDDAELQWHTSTARLQVDVWGKGPQPQDEAEVLAVAALLRAAARDLVGDYPGGSISSSSPGQVISGQEGTSGRYRAIVDLTIEFHPAT